MLHDVPIIRNNNTTVMNKLCDRHKRNLRRLGGDKLPQNQL